MHPDQPPEPWAAFLHALDRTVPEAVALHCIGGFAVSLCHGLERPTGDIDVVEVIPNEAKVGLATLAGRGSSLHRQHKLYLQIVTVASLPYSYEDRLTELFPATFERLRLLVPDPPRYASGSPPSAKNSVASRCTCFVPAPRSLSRSRESGVSNCSDS
ncbi:MAG TPA: hypothetical protein VLA20_01605 [Vicinamibacterales bacterium]|nr:hypothetical protein [Vicinamibacterales bacterium]